MGFDSVTVRSEDGRARVLTPEEFYGIPLIERVGMLCKGAVQFFKDGKQVPATEAVKQR